MTSKQIQVQIDASINDNPQQALISAVLEVALQSALARELSAKAIDEALTLIKKALDEL